MRRSGAFMGGAAPFQSRWRTGVPGRRVRGRAPAPGAACRRVWWRRTPPSPPARVWGLPVTRWMTARRPRSSRQSGWQGHGFDSLGFGRQGARPGFLTRPHLSFPTVPGTRRAGGPPIFGSATRQGPGDGEASMNRPTGQGDGLRSGWRDALGRPLPPHPGPPVAGGAAQGPPATDPITTMTSASRSTGPWSTSRSSSDRTASPVPSAACRRSSSTMARRILSSMSDAPRCGPCGTMSGP